MAVENSPHQADHKAFWSNWMERLKQTCAFLPSYAWLFLISEEWRNFETWLQRRFLMSKIYNCFCISGRRKNLWRTPDSTGDNPTRKGYEEQAKRPQEMEKKRGWLTWKIVSYRSESVGRKWDLSKAGLCYTLQRKLKTRCKMFFSHINKQRAKRGIWGCSAVKIGVWGKR